MATYYYAETDGEVFLVDRAGVLSFPEREDELPCPVERRFAVPVLGHTVWFCKPLLEEHPGWVYKDDIPGLDNVAPVVRKAVDTSQPRCVAAGVLLRDDKVCMVKASRGHTKGFWNLPGGFLEYGEGPRDAVRRELREELGCEVEVLELLGAFDHLFPHTGRHMIAFVYRCDTEAEMLVPAKGEIEAVGWFPLDEALRMTRNPFAARALAEMEEQLRSRPAASVHHKG